ncbi:MAG TPA: type III polyketide synthase [Candidatus Dormibacteraeota bacterium]|nr:type III polyketide synthase [Candidatus Dormibacteraeota bacterium]
MPTGRPSPKKNPPPGGLKRRPENTGGRAGLATHPVKNGREGLTSSALIGFGTALPEHTIDGATSLSLLSAYWPRLRGATPEPLTRHLVAPVEWLLRPRSLGETMRAYAEHAPRLARQASCRALADAGVRPADIDLVISVSCTGYLIPSLDVRLAAEIGLRPDVTRLPLTELGCSGGAAAVAAAHRHLTAYPDDRVLVIAVELPTLTFQPADRSLDNLTAAMVFGDGAAAAVVASSASGLQVRGAASRLLPNSEEALGFELRDGGFHVVLDRRLPRLIEQRLPEVIADFATQQGIDTPGFYAVHAGGPRVFDAVETALRLPAGALAPSRRVFREVGNLSSASILFSLAELPDSTAGDGLAIAFGPGVTIELLHLRRVP